MRKLIVVFVLVVAGCGGSSGGGSAGGAGSTGGGGAAGGSAGSGGGSAGSGGVVDMTVPKTGDLSGPASACGHPGDVGNSIGVGKYCMSIFDCPSTAIICTAINNANEPANDQTFFCTTTCKGLTDTTTCGAGAACLMQGANLACVPTSCGSVAPPTTDMK
jgi:hypothetical protein